MSPEDGANVRPRRFLDEHHPGWLANELTAGGLDTVALTEHREYLRGADDTQVLRAAAADGRVVVTEDVSTFGAAITAVPDDVGVIFCHYRRFPRTRPGLARLRRALVALAAVPPHAHGLRAAPVVWWLSDDGRQHRGRWPAGEPPHPR